MKEKYHEFRLLGLGFLICGVLQVCEFYSINLLGIKSSQIFTTLVSLTLAYLMWALNGVLNELNRYFCIQERMYTQWNEMYGTNDSGRGDEE